MARLSVAELADGWALDAEIINEAEMKPTFVGAMVNRKIIIRIMAGVLATPDHLQVSFRWPDHTEELVTLGGTAPNDAWLRASAVGIYRFSCPAKLVAGKGSLVVRITHAVDGIDQVEETRQIVDIYAKLNTMQDVP